MFAILPLQDWLAIDERLRFTDPDAERINIPADPNHYWRYRMHITLEQLISEDEFNEQVRSLVALR
jgi:4-alpha-glucanotransferase